MIRRFYFNVFDIDDFEKARHAVFMFKDLFGLSRFDEDSLIRFTLTVRKNYRRVPYHNWTHGFSVANTMYAIIKHSGDVFREEEVGAQRDCGCPAHCPAARQPYAYRVPLPRRLADASSTQGRTGGSFGWVGKLLVGPGFAYLAPAGPAGPRPGGT